MTKSRRTSDLVNSILVNPDNSVNIHEGTESPYFLLTTGATTTPEQGMLFWDADRQTAGLQMNGVEARLGQDNFWYVKNQSGSDILKGTVVMAVGALGSSSRILVAPMVADGSVEEQYLLGITAEDILNGEDGFVMNIGKIRGIDTTQYGTQAGQVLYCDPSVPGGLTITQPDAPNLDIPIAFTVDYKSNGTLAIRVNPGYHIGELHDVYSNSPSNNDILLYNSTNSRWENTPLASAVPTPTLDEVTTAGDTTSNSVNTGLLTTSVTAPNNTSTTTSLKVKVNRANVANGATNRLLFQDYVRGPSSASILGDVGSLDFFRLVSASNTRGRFDVNIKQESPGDTQVRVFSVNYDGTTYLNINGGNTLIGTTTDAGYKLDVNGTAIVRDYTQIVNSNSWTSSSDAFTLVLPNTPNAQNNGHSFKIRRNATVKLSDRYPETLNVGFHVNYFNTSLNAYFGRNYSNLASTGLGAVRNSTGTHDFSGSIPSGISTGGEVTNNNVGTGLCVIERYVKENYTAATAATTYGVYSISTTSSLSINGAYKRWVGGYFSARPNYSTNNDNAVSIGVWGDAQGGEFNYAGLFTGGNVGIGITNPSYLLHVNGTVSAQLTNATQTDQVYYDSTTGELTYGALPVVATPTLDEVTTAGSNSTNNISITKAFPALFLDHVGTGTQYSGATIVLKNNLIASTPADTVMGTIAFTDSGGSSKASIVFSKGTNDANIDLKANRFATVDLRVATSGNTLIGTTTDAGYKLDVNGTVRSVKNKIDITPTTDTIALDIRGTGTPNDFFTVSNATGGANDVFLPIFFYKAATYGYNGGTNRYPSGVYGGGFIAAVDDSSYPSSAGAGAAMHFNSRAYANNGPLSNRYLFSWGSWLTTHMAMTAGGNLLIGTTTDSGEKLQINGNADISGDIYADGDVGIGNDAPAYKLDVSGDINADGDFYQNGVQGATGTVNLALSGGGSVTLEINGGIITSIV